MGHSLLANSVSTTAMIAPSVAPIIGIRSVSATTKASGTENGTPSAVKHTNDASPATSEMRMLPIM